MNGASSSKPWCAILEHSMASTSNTYWSQSVEQGLSELKSSSTGLTTAEAEKRLLLNGKNKFGEKRQEWQIVVFLSKILNPLILILLAASFISVFFGEFLNFSIILTIILISISIDYYQERQAEEAASRLRSQVSLRSKVWREGQELEIPATHLVVGDVIRVGVGDIIPADGRLIESKDLLIEQSALTGESYPQAKQVNQVPATSQLSERTNMVYTGTHVVSGEGKILVTTTGNSTEFGKVAKQLEVKRPKTSFQVGIEQFGFLLMRFTLVLVIFVFFVNMLFQHDVLESFLFAIALAVGLTPELLPMIITINLSKGALRMSKKGVIVKFLPAIENFGSMDILSTDKTGTLTEGKIVLERYEDINGNEDQQVLRYGYMNSQFQTGFQSPIDTAILAHTEVNSHGYDKLDEIPYDFERRRLSVIVNHADEILLIVKGAPESLFDRTKVYMKDGESKPMTVQVQAKIKARFDELSRQGYRVLAIATRTIAKKEKYSADDETNLTFVGLMSFLDPPKKSAKEAIAQMEKEGISLKILTGDNELVTSKICEELDIEVLGTIVGDELDTKNDDALIQIVKNTTIFARLNPDQKKRVVVALRGAGYSVGYLGDGINDAPSLRAADIGISVNNAVDVAKESADIILLHNDLHVLKDGVIEGRKTHANVMKYVMMGASSNFGNMFSLAGASLLLSFLPMLPIQVLLNNLLYDFSQMSIPTDRVDSQTIRKPKKWDIQFIKHFMIVFGPISSFFDFATFFLLLHYYQAGASMFQSGWFLESLVSQSLIIFAIRTKVTPFFQSRPSTTLLLSALVVIAVASLLVQTQLGAIFSFTSLPFAYFINLAEIMVCYFFAVDFAKKWFYKRYEL